MLREAFAATGDALWHVGRLQFLGQVDIDLPTHGDNGVRKFDVPAKTHRAFLICLPTAFNLCPTAGDDQTVVRRFLEDAGLH